MTYQERYEAYRAQIEQFLADDLSDTGRGQGGFGSTGK